MRVRRSRTSKYREAINPSHARARLKEVDKAPTNAYDAVMAKKRASFTDQIRQAIADSGKTQYVIAKETGIDKSALNKFFHGERGMNCDSLDRLAENLGLRVVLDEGRKTKGK